jgi:hypothetical protein
VWRSGYDKDYSAYRKALKEMEISPNKIKYLVLTHHHEQSPGYLAVRLTAAHGSFLNHRFLASECTAWLPDQ